MINTRRADELSEFPGPVYSPQDYSVTWPRASPKLCEGLHSSNLGGDAVASLRLPAARPRMMGQPRTNDARRP